MLQPTNLTASLPRMAQTITLGAISTILLTLVTTSTIVDLARADANQDRDQCAQQLVGLATCLPYVGGDAKAPTPDCCNGLKQVLKSNKKCLCVVVRDRNDPELGLNINATLALGLPSVCHAPANVSQCPALLHMDPNSPEAQVFNQFGKSSNPGASTPSLSPTGAISPTPGSNSLAPTASAPMKTIINKFYTSGIMSLLVITFFYMHHDLLM